MLRGRLGLRILYKHPGPFLLGAKARLRFAAVVIVMLFASDWIGENILLEPWAKWYLDFHLRRLEKVQEQVTRVVRIDADEHERLFGGRSPLPGSAVVQAACAIAGRGATVVVVDLDTSSPRAFPENLRLPDSPAPIVWAVDTVTRLDDSRTLVERPDRVLGGRLAAQPLYGVSRMPGDFDGVIRRWDHLRFIDEYWRPTLPWAAVQQYCEQQGQNCGDALGIEGRRASHVAPTDLSPVRFTRDVDFQRIRLSEFMTEALADVPTFCPILPPDPRLKGRIVILGGFYSREDIHDTPWGARAGAELVAMAAEQLFQPKPPHQVATLAKWLTKVCLALAIALIHHWFRPTAATMVTVAAFPLAVLLVGELFFRLGGYEAAIVTFGVGILIEQLVGATERAEHWTHQAERLQVGDRV